MTTKTRLQKLEKERGKVKMTWREFIETATVDGKIDGAPEDVAAAWADFIAEKLAEKDAEK